MAVEIRRAQLVEEGTPDEQVLTHGDAIDLRGLDDLFQWASEMVADGGEGWHRRARDPRLKQNLLKIIHENAAQRAQSRAADEIAYLQRRVISLLAALQESTAELATCKQIMIGQYFAMQRIPQLEEELVQLKATAADPHEVEAERNELLSALTKTSKERDILEELLTINESENDRLVSLLQESRDELHQIKKRSWWQRLLNR